MLHRQIQKREVGETLKAFKHIKYTTSQQEILSFHSKCIMIVDLCLASFTLSKIWCLSVWFKSQKLQNWVFFRGLFWDRVESSRDQDILKNPSFYWPQSPGLLCLKLCVYQVKALHFLALNLESAWPSFSLQVRILYFNQRTARPQIELALHGGHSKKRNFANKQQGSGCDCWPRDSSISIPLDMADGAEAWGQASRTQQGWAEISDFLKKL